MDLLPNTHDGIANLNNSERDYGSSDCKNFLSYLSTLSRSFKNGWLGQGSGFSIETKRRSDRIAEDHKDGMGDSHTNGVLGAWNRPDSPLAKLWPNQIQTIVEMTRLYEGGNDRPMKISVNHLDHHSLFFQENYNKLMRGERISDSGLKIFEPMMNAYIVGAMQSGKAAVLAWLYFNLPAMLYLKTGIVHEVLCLVPNMIDLNTQFIGVMRQSWYAHSQLTLQYTDKKGEKSQITPARYFFDVLKQGDDDGNFEIQRFVRRTMVKDTKELMERARIAHEKGHRVILMIDECHHGTDVDGVFAKNAQEFVDAAKSPECDNVMVVGISATGWEQAYKESFARVMLYLDKGYSGPDVFGGVQFPTMPGYVPKSPILYDYSHYFDIRGPDGRHVQLDYESTQSIDRYMGGVLRMTPARKLRVRSNKDVFEEIQRSYEDYCQKFFIRIATMVKKLLFTANFLSSQGMCFRIAIKNTAAKVIQQEVGKILEKWGHKVAWLDGYNRQESQTIKQLCSQAGLSKYVVFFTGGARMGVNFPSSCGYFVDLTKDSSTSTSELQGFYGRACGYFKDTAVFLSSANLRSIQNYLAYGIPSKRAHSRTETEDGLRAGAIQLFVDIYSATVAADAKNGNSDAKAMMNIFYEIHRITSDDGEFHGNGVNSHELLNLIEQAKDLIEKNTNWVSIGQRGGTSFHNIKFVRYALTDKDRKERNKADKNNTESRFLTTYGSGMSRGPKDKLNLPDRRLYVGDTVARRWQGDESKRRVKHAIDTPSGMRHVYHEEIWFGGKQSDFKLDAKKAKEAKRVHMFVLALQSPTQSTIEPSDYRQLPINGVSMWGNNYNQQETLNA